MQAPILTAILLAALLMPGAFAGPSVTTVATVPVDGEDVAFCILASCGNLCPALCFTYYATIDVAAEADPRATTSVSIWHETNGEGGLQRGPPCGAPDCARYDTEVHRSDLSIDEATLAALVEDLLTYRPIRCDSSYNCEIGLI